MDAEWERHWNTVCLGIITIATATVGAALFASDIASIDLSSKEISVQTLQMLKICAVFVVLAVHLWLVETASESIFTSSADLEYRGTSKRAQAAYAFGGFVIILVSLIGLLVLNLTAALLKTV